MGALAKNAVSSVVSSAQTSPSVRCSIARGEGPDAHHILESVILATLFCGRGFGIFGKLGFAAITGTAMLICVLIAVFAKLYLSRFAQGPLETLVSR